MPNVVQRRVALLGEDGKFADSMTPQAVLDAVAHVDQAAAGIDGSLAEMLAKSANLGDVPSPAAARANLGAAPATHTHTLDEVAGLPSALATVFIDGGGPSASATVTYDGGAPSLATVGAIIDGGSPRGTAWVDLYDIEQASAFGRSLLAAKTDSAARTLLGAGEGSASDSLIVTGYLASEGFQMDRTIVWHDEFDNPVLDTTKWIALNRAITYTYLTSRKQNVFIENSCLIIRAQKETYSGKSWTSAWLRTDGLFAFKYGRVEARIRCPMGPGMWPAFWTHGDTWHVKPDYISGEIDILERWGSEPSNKITLYRAPDPPASAGVNVNGGTYPIDASDWHVYAMEWTPEKIEFFVDGVKVGLTMDVPYFTNNTGWNPYHNPQTLQLDNMVGEAGWNPPIDSTTPSPADMVIDWVRVYAPVGTSARVRQQSVAVEPPTLSLGVGVDAQLVATITPELASDQTVRWSSSDPAVCTVAENHLADTIGSEYVARGGVKTWVTGIAPGTATITAKTNEYYVATCVVTVS